MANIFDKFLNSMRLYDDEETEDDVEYLDKEDEETEVEVPAPAPARPRRREQPASAEDASEAPQVRPVRNSAPVRRSNVTSMRQSARSGGSLMEVSMVRPSSMEDARDICEMLLSGRAVVVNMEGVQVELAQRIIDFASGACYSINGNLQKISSYIFIITPNNIELSGDFQNVLNSMSGSLRVDD